MRFLSRIGALGVVACLVGCGGGSSSDNNVPPPPPPPKITVSISPSSATIPVGTLQPFYAVVGGAPSTSVSWTASAGTIDQSGNYTAPAAVPSGGSVTVTATANTSPPASGSATVTITTQSIGLTIAPPTATVKAGFFTLYSAAVTGTTNNVVTWSVGDLAGDSTYPGSISGGFYVAPVPVLSPDTFTISAVSNADPTKSASATVNVIPLENQEQQMFPIKLGASGVNAKAGDCCSGTLGSLLVDEKGKQYILSNNHVMGRVGHAAAGEAIVHPGYVDTLCNFSTPKAVANFTYAPPIASSNVDAAIAEVAPGAVDNRGQIIGLGGIAVDGSYMSAPPANTIVAATIGMSVAKSGRTTGLSCGTVLAINGTVCVDIPAECGNPSEITQCFYHQVVMGNLVKPGDSGSLIVGAKTSQPMGLVAGLSADGQYTTANPVTDILSALKSGTGNTFSFVGGGEHPVSCSIPSQASSQQKSAQQSIVIPPNEVAHAMDVQRRHERQIMEDPALIGMAIGNGLNPGHASFLIFVEHGKVPEQLPPDLEGVPVRVITTERFQANVQGATPRFNAGSSSHLLSH